jgi:hypothetical protein
VKDQALPFRRIEIRLPLGFLQELLGDCDIALLQEVKERVLLPLRRVEPPIGIAAPSRR